MTFQNPHVYYTHRQQKEDTNVIYRLAVAEYGFVQEPNDVHSELLERYRCNVHAAQEKLAQSLVEAGVDTKQYNLCEKHWVADNFMYYKCWVEKKAV